MGSYSLSVSVKVYFDQFARHWYEMARDAGREVGSSNLGLWGLHVGLMKKELVGGGR